LKSFKNTFNNKTVIVTGHTGFKGSWLSIWLSSLGANVIGISDRIPSEPSNFLASDVEKIIEDIRIDIRDTKIVNKTIEKINPDFIFHLAAQALVRTSYKSPLDTISTNSIGSANIMEALRNLTKPVVAVMITSDKVYDNREWVWGYRETDRIGGKDPYSASKGMAEIAIYSYIESFYKDPNSNVKIGIARAGNVIGGGDWASDRLVPDCMRAWSKGEIVEVRSPNSTRPWQHVLEPLSGYLTLASNLSESKKYHSEAFNFGPHANQNYSVREIIDEMANHWKQVRWNDISQNQKHLHEAGLLKLNCDKALSELHWEPVLQFDETVKMTVEWYKHYYEKKFLSMFDFTLQQIQYFTTLANKRSISWSINND
jgi:CDP-glucose 4,6-dehydratase